MSQTAVGRDWLGYRGKLMRNNRILQLRATASSYYRHEQRLSRQTHSKNKTQTLCVYLPHRHLSKQVVIFSLSLLCRSRSYYLQMIFF